MLTFGGRRIYLVAGATDMRKWFNGLAGIVRDRLEADPMSRHEEQLSLLLRGFDTDELRPRRWRRRSSAAG